MGCKHGYQQPDSHSHRYLPPSEVRASRAALLGCEGLGWRFWGRKSVRHKDNALRACARRGGATLIEASDGF